MHRSSPWMLPLTDGCVGVWAPRGYQRDRMRHAGKPPAAPVNRGSKAVPHGQRGASRAGGAQSPYSSAALANSHRGRRHGRCGGRRAAGRPPGMPWASCKPICAPVFGIPRMHCGNNKTIPRKNKTHEPNLIQTTSTRRHACATLTVAGPWAHGPGLRAAALAEAISVTRGRAPSGPVRRLCVHGSMVIRALVRAWCDQRGPAPMFLGGCARVRMADAPVRAPRS